MCVRDMRVFAARSFFCISSFAFCDCFFFFVIHFLFSSFVSTFGTDFYMVFFVDNLVDRQCTVWVATADADCTSDPDDSQTNTHRMQPARASNSKTHTHFLCRVLAKTIIITHTHTHNERCKTQTKYTQHIKKHRIESRMGRKYVVMHHLSLVRMEEAEESEPNNNKKKKRIRNDSLMVFVSNSSSSGLWI